MDSSRSANRCSSVAAHFASEALHRKASTGVGCRRENSTCTDYVHTCVGVGSATGTCDADPFVPAVLIVNVACGSVTLTESA